MFDERIKELVAVGASVTANCQPCLEYHTAKAREFGACTDDILAAVEVGKLVQRGAAAKMDRFAEAHVRGTQVPETAAACGCE